MEVTKVFNNNVVLAKDGSQALVLIGKGIGFGKKPGQPITVTDEIDVYRPEAENWLKNFQEAVTSIPPEYFELASEIIKKASAALQTTFNSYLLIALADHIQFAIYRHQHDMDIRNELLWEIKRIYPREYAAGQDALQMTNQRFQVQLLPDEAGFIAMKFVENSMQGSTDRTTKEMTKLINGMLDIVQYQLGRPLDSDSLSFQRLLVHLRFFAQRTVMHVADPNGPDDDFLYDHVAQKYPQAFACAQKVTTFVTKSTARPVARGEQVYLTVHIQRLIAESNQ
ncbi:PRD domain-containing protein [Schleiferilactobacillus shenzhenensis]|uniref:PRD domain-containing protein n=1 Tax=Schleiferilactobacillus shenzhenensis LY-73 TaxID=1231336 RepID=U4TMH2_9LACO|nr:PRD domain-containing protein [Schleiferilactobacillus shenzhenensis]ERL66081.1 hypothetical protein L248_1173 [Schleiferilactobacillus shenzhenensis LY-73]